MIQVKWGQALMSLTSAFIGALAVVAASWIGTNGDTAVAKREYEIHQLRLASERILALEQSNKELIDEISKLRGQVTLLKAQIEYEIGPTQLLFSFLEALEEAPAWVKVYDDDRDEFIMLYINRAYENFYDVTRERYVGATDAEVWPAEIAAVYAENDLRVLLSRDRKRVREPVIDRAGNKVNMMMWKLFLRMPDGRASIIGIQVEDDSGV